DLLGGSPDEVPDRYDAVDPTGLKTPARVVVVHGADDDWVPIEMSRDYARTCGATLLQLDGVEHFGLIDPDSAAWPTVLEAFAQAIREGQAG
ncbi:MAG: alpha/beta hydrolase family protein, partial [Stackebrandtia sp.]